MGGGRRHSTLRDSALTSCKEIRMRYEFSNEILPLFKHLSPEEAVRHSNSDYFHGNINGSGQAPKNNQELSKLKVTSKKLITSDDFYQMSTNLRP